MTIQRAIEVLNEYEIVEVSRGVFTIAYNGGEADIVGEQRIIDLARILEDEE
jgi:hypothetical protein